ncbi:floral homeotic protein [Anaeramoeba ignava]|uniref:Floral homeotic protein n=1 Tax=Anaeramoeba ignava TaxID=1746090 RepID=A0A9Q0LCB7_ANAIG|nr:floral homeotic protein [Anaeramoeba ignava]
MKNDQEIYYIHKDTKMNDLDHENYEKLFEKLDQKIKSIKEKRSLSDGFHRKRKQVGKWRLAYQNLTNERGPWGSLDLNANSDSQKQKGIH